MGRPEEGAKIVRLLRVKNHDFTAENLIFSNFRGARAGCASPGSAPVMVRVLASSAVDRGFEARSGQSKDFKLVFVASPLSTQH